MREVIGDLTQQASHHHPKKKKRCGCRTTTPTTMATQKKRNTNCNTFLVPSPDPQEPCHAELHKGQEDADSGVDIVWPPFVLDLAVDLEIRHATVEVDLASAQATTK